MILRILLISCAVLSPSLAKMDLVKFETLERNCFKTSDMEPFRVNGQGTPLSSTLENFIAMAEKFEVANPTANLKDELIYFISEFLFENIKITNGKIHQRYVERADMTLVDSLWDPDINHIFRLPIFDPYTDDEKCSLYFMISHSVMEKDTVLQRSYSNFSSPQRALNEDDYFPQEVGVVAIRGANGPVSLSKVLLGLLVGLDRHKSQQSLREFALHLRRVAHEEMLDEIVDPLYVVTMGEVLMLSAWEGFERMGMTKNGEWISIPLSSGERIEGFCPMVYSHGFNDNTKMLPAYSYASVRGAADGLILGLAVNKIYDPEAKLSQVLRMYYSPRGIITDYNIDDINDKRVSFCNRNALIQALEPKIQEQMKMYGYLIAVAENDVYKSYDRSKSQYDKNRNAIYFENNENDFCMQTTSLENPEDLTAETFLDIIVIMDSSNSEENFIDQQLITGYIARQLDLSYYGSRMTVFLDRSDETSMSSVSESSPNTVLAPVVDETYSSSCAACIVGQADYDTIQSKYNILEREDVIIALDQLLLEKKEAELTKNGVNGKVVIFFNYEDGDGRPTNNKVQGNVDKALRNLNLRHQDVLFYSVGLDPEILKKYSRNDASLILLGTDDKPHEIADKIMKKIATAPSLLQYADCEAATNEKSATFENFVSPNNIQHYMMPAEYFYKSFNARVMFESQNGLVRVCYNRATMKPENEKKFCKDTNSSAGVEFEVSNPCKGFTSESCKPLYFAVMGIDPISERNGNQAQRRRSPCKINDRWCSKLDQIKFKVSHEGIRCSGCLGIGATQTVILFTLLLTFLLHKM